MNDFTAAYGDHVIVKDVTFEVRRGEVFVILGGSGSGKSTVLKHMIGLYPPYKGDILLDGRSIVTAEGKDRLDILQSIGVMYQSGALFGNMTLLENARLPMEEFTDLPQDAMDLIATMNLSLVGLGDSTHLLPSEISGGMQKRAAIARAMALDPETIPTLRRDDAATVQENITLMGGLFRSLIFGIIVAGIGLRRGRRRRSPPSWAP